jgi:TAT (twin-arginine translocation) pathway signal sequence
VNERELIGRRDFLKGSAGGLAAAVSLPHILPPAGFGALSLTFLLQSAVFEVIPRRAATIM